MTTVKKGDQVSDFELPDLELVTVGVNRADEALRYR